MRRSNQLLLAFFGHHKCGTGWIGGILRTVAYELKLNYANVNHPADFGYDLGTFVEENAVDFLAYNEAEYEYVKQLQNCRGFHVVRDPRDICVSAYYSHLYSHRTDIWPELLEFRKKLESLSKEDGLLLDMQFIEHVMRHLHSWDYGSLPHVREMRFEELVQNPYGHLLNIFQFLGILDKERFVWERRIVYLFYRGLRRIERMSRGHVSIPVAPRRLPAERVLGIIWENDFSQQAGGRKPGQEDQTSHYRKGIIGDWRNNFTQEHIDEFKRRYNQVLIKLGYEQDPAWE